MMHIRKCPKCSSYTLDEKCSCGEATVRPKPPKYSPEDKYAEYRRRYKHGIGVEDKSAGKAEDK